MCSRLLNGRAFCKGNRLCLVILHRRAVLSRRIFLDTGGSLPGSAPSGKVIAAFPLRGCPRLAGYSCQPTMARPEGLKCRLQGVVS